jgi:predicted dehydrogenase
MSESMRTWKVGLVGTGYWSQYHLNAWNQLPGAQIAALCNRSREKLEQRGQQYEIPAASLFTSIDEMLVNSDIDVVDIVTGPETHLELVKKAAQAGKHIMCQKPFATSYEEAQEMVKAAHDHGVRLMVTENWRWLQPNQMIKRILDENLLGKLHIVRYIHTDYYTPRMKPDTPLPQPFFRHMPRLLFYEMGAHWFDTIRFLFGNPKRLYAETLRISPHITGEDTGIITLGYDDLVVVMDMSWATRRELGGELSEHVHAEHREQMSIEGELATLKLYMDGSISLIDRNGHESTLAASTELDHGASHSRLQSHFIDCLNTGSPFQTSGEDNLQTLKLIFSTYESAARHEVIPI